MSKGHGGKPFVSGDPRAKPFPKGTSGNPGGRPRTISHYILQQTDDGKEMIDLLVLVMRKGPLKFRVAVAKELLDRSQGRPMQYPLVRREETFFLLMETFLSKTKELLGEEAAKKVIEAARAATQSTGCTREPY